MTMERVWAIAREILGEEVGRGPERHVPDGTVIPLRSDGGRERREKVWLLTRRAAPPTARRLTRHRSRSPTASIRSMPTR